MFCGSSAVLIARMANSGVDVIIFTSSPQVDRLYQVAAEKGDGALLAGRGDVSAEDGLFHSHCQLASGSFAAAANIQ